MRKLVYILSFSGGKDSTAMWIYATKELGLDVIPVFADTGNEHQLTYRYVNDIEIALGPITRVKADFTDQITRKREYIKAKWEDKLTKTIAGKWQRFEETPEDLDPPGWVPEDPTEMVQANGYGWKPAIIGMTKKEAQKVIKRALKILHPTGNPFLDLCLWKGRFPSTKARFCTQELKIIPMLEQVTMPLLEAGYTVISLQGVRAEESPARAKMPEHEDTPEGFHIWRPLLKWTADDVFNMHRRYGIEPNPLYKLGMTRVGCMPCINCNKGELFEIARRFPEEVARISEWEKIVAKASKRGTSSFFKHDEIAGNSIDEWVEWSKTAYGGKQYDLVKALEFDEVPQCSSVYGLCE